MVLQSQVGGMFFFEFFVCDIPLYSQLHGWFALGIVLENGDVDSEKPLWLIGIAVLSLPAPDCRDA